MVVQEGGITIHYGTQALSMDLDDLKEEYLVEAFNLPFTPRTMYEIIDQSAKSGTKRLIPISKKEKFKVGHSYHIQRRESVPPMIPSIPPAALQHIRDQPALAAGGKSDLGGEWQPLPEIAKNAVVLCRAVYAADDQDLENYLMTNLKDHNFEKLLRSRHGRSCFVMAEERDQERVYIAFCGSHKNEGWQDHFWAHQKPSSQGAPSLEGLVHSGFLERAMDFPMEKILKDSDILSKNIIFCGHSFGGAIAILAAVMTMANLKLHSAGTREKRNLWIKCVTFGAPMVGDVDFRQFCQSHRLDRHIYNFVEAQDPIPHIISLCQTLSAKLLRIHIDIVKERSKVHNEKAECEICSDLYRQKVQYVQLLKGIVSLVEPALELTSLAVPKSAETVILSKGSCQIIEDVMVASMNHKAEDQRMYTYLGNLLLSQNCSVAPLYVQYGEESAIDELLENAFKRSLSERRPGIAVSHGVHNYEYIIGRWAKRVKNYPTTKPSTYKSASTDGISRQIQFLNTFQPQVESGELVRVNAHGKDYLRLRLKGRHLFEFVIDKCAFNFGYPFATNPETCKKQMQVDGSETLTFEERFREDPYVSDFGTVIRLATKFGECDYLLRISQIRNVKIPTMEETLSNHESLAILVKRAIQRGMAVAHLTRNHRPGKSSWKPIKEKIIKEVMHLGTHVLNETDRNVLSNIFSDTSSRNQFILSNEQEFYKVQCICDHIQTFLRSPMELTARNTIFKTIGIAVAALLGGLALACAAGPGMVIIGMTEAASMSAAGLAGSFGFFSTGFMTNYFFTSSPVDKNYEIVLSWLTLELMEKCQKQANGTRDPQALQMLQHVSDLREDGSLFNLEKALLLMYKPEIGIGNFVGCDMAMYH
ncbi:hypothetical protein TCAL_14728 [Tigriopus californicus]|uniref:Fungal lipase-type domain-containing protein n=1 Tax=Tigriopus californicus TaxID=6832 RepID=A0A553PGT4_TIGCA|nr:hypothetical protein TCAL_14728 [Tigriopus californicus]